jgi:O-acetyl-ADP-ribose deacetylase (regulator of RNase III)
MTVPLESRIRLVVGDITRLDVGAIVTAANQALAGGGGVDGAVHNAAGPELVESLRAVAPCPAGSARITPGFNLDAKFVIHAVGPIFHELSADSATLASTYRSSLALAAENDIAQIALPCISTGVYGFPKRPACEIAIRTVLTWLRSHAKPEVVVFCCYQDADATLYRERLEELGML